MHRRLLAVAAVVLVLAAPTDAGRLGKRDLRLPMSDGVEVAASLYLPAGATPGAGWPAVMVFHGLGGDRRSSNAIAEQHLVEQGYAVLTVDHRGHGDSGGVVDIDGPREIVDVRALFGWLADRSDVDGDRIGAIGFSLGGGAVWRATGASPSGRSCR